MKKSTMKIRTCLALLLLVFSGSAMAEHGCPDGYVPAFQGGTQNRTCVVDYSLPVWQEQGGQSAQPAEQWEDRWGAIATDSENAKLGVVTNMPDKETAERGALEECRNGGGINCELQLAYHNQCAAMVVGDRMMNSWGAGSIKQAEKIGLSECWKDDTNCRVYYSGCSLPERVR